MQMRRMALGPLQLMRNVGAKMSRWDPVRLVTMGYGTYVLGTWILLSVPWCQSDDPVPAIDNLFTAASAVTTTGLATVSTPGSYSFLGQLVILVAFQLGGLGYMTIGSFVLLAREQRISRVREEIAETVFALPEGFQIRAFLRYVVLFAALIEVAGACALYFVWRDHGITSPWPAIFHAVSAFCTAGFSIFPDSLEQFRADFWTNAIISALSLTGAVGFLVLSDAWLSLTGRRKRTTLTSRIILHMTVWPLLGGALLLFLSEGTFQPLRASERLLASLFQSMTALTTVGFDTHPIGMMGTAATFVLILLMLLGASPAGTGGGIKSTSVSAAFALLVSVLRRRSVVTFWHTRVPSHRLYTAFAGIALYLTTFAIGTFLLLNLQTEIFEDVVFECASALGTVGLSRGMTPDLTPLGKLVVVAMMYVGRVGPLTFAMAFVGLAGTAPKPAELDDLAV